MRHAVAQTTNVRDLFGAVAELKGRAPNTPGIALVVGETGLGKTTAVKYVAVQINAVYVRALATWTPRAMLAAIMHEMEAAPLGSSSEMVAWIADALTARELTLIIDEADYLVVVKRLVETLRDIHDISSMPLILVGMHDFRKQVSRRPQLAGRVSQWVGFSPATEADTALIARQLCEVDVDADLLAQLRSETGGSIRGLVVGLSRIESFARRHNLTSINAEQWGQREMTMKAAK